MGMRKANKIICLGKGVVIEQGTHEELMKAGGTYARYMSLQPQSTGQLNGSKIDLHEVVAKVRQRDPAQAVELLRDLLAEWHPVGLRRKSGPGVLLDRESSNASASSDWEATAAYAKRQVAALTKTRPS